MKSDGEKELDLLKRTADTDPDVAIRFLEILNDLQTDTANKLGISVQELDDILLGKKQVCRIVYTKSGRDIVQCIDRCAAEILNHKVMEDSMSDNIISFSKESDRISKERLNYDRQIAGKVDEAINRVSKIFSEFLDKQYGVLDPNDKRTAPPQRIHDYYSMCKFTAMLLMVRVLPIFKEPQQIKEIEDFSRALREMSSMLSKFGEEGLEELSRGILSILEMNMEDE